MVRIIESNPANPCIQHRLARRADRRWRCIIDISNVSSRRHGQIRGAYSPEGQTTRTISNSDVGTTRAIQLRVCANCSERIRLIEQNISTGSSDIQIGQHSGWNHLGYISISADDQIK